MLGIAAIGCSEVDSPEGFVTSAMRENAQRNVDRYDWAQERVAELQGRVAPFMELNLEALWSMLPSQEMGRSARPSSPHSTVSSHDICCPQCYLDFGEDVGAADYHVDLLGRPWQVQCKRSGEWFPKNNFAAYFESAQDASGRFRLGEGDPQFLRPREGVSGEAREWVSDGSGLEYDGYQWYFTGVYAMKLWEGLTKAAHDMATLYTLTEESEYARRAAVILDRMADFYPEIDEQAGRDLGFYTSYGPGRIMGRGWEYGRIRRPVAEAYSFIRDALLRDKELLAFVSRMSEKYDGADKTSSAALDAHLREHLLVEFIEDVMENENPAKARGRAQVAVAVVAAALNDPERMPGYIEWLLQEDGGQLPDVLVEHMQRDGFNVNSGHVYMISTGFSMYRIAEILMQADASKLNLYTAFPNLISSFTMLSHTRVLEKTQPQMGDGGSSMSMGRKRYPMRMLVEGFRRFETEGIAREIMLNHPKNWADRVRAEAIYDRDPEAVVESIKAYAAAELKPHRSYNSGGTGFAALQAPYRDTERAAGLWYGRSMNPSHAHADRLTLHLWAFDTVLMPDMGYPAHTGDWPKRHGFTRHTVSHNTLMINDRRQGASYSGKTRLFAEKGPLRVVDVDGIGVPTDRPWKDGRKWDEPIYEDVDTYRRTVVMVDINESDSYLLDLFWARGGTSHRLIQNSGSKSASIEGVDMVRQERGTLAGENVAYGEFYDKNRDRHWGYRGSGLQYLKNVERSSGSAESFRITWPIHGVDGAYMRLHNLTQVDEVALADGEPSRGRPDRIRYSVRSRAGDDLQSQFISVIEPYRDDPFIEGVEVLKRVEAEGQPFAVAVEVTLRDGRKDVLMVREEAGTLAVDDVSLDGRLGLIRYDAAGEVERIVAITANEVRSGSEAVSATPISGRLKGFNDSDPMNVRLQLETDTALSEALIGRTIIVDNEAIADGSYRIEGVPSPDTLNLGQTSLAERLADPKDFDAGVLYNIQPGESFLIPGAASWERE